MNETYFFDTYAFFEILNANLEYKRFESVQIVTTVFNLAELNYGLKKRLSETVADKITEEYYNTIVEVTLEDIQKAMSLKIKYKEFSIPDTIGYLIAKRLGIKFLTGDEGFRDFENVEFIKK